MLNKISVAEQADMIVNGYAFTLRDGAVRVFNLNRSNRACVLSMSGEVLETSMDDIELSIVLDYFERNRKYLVEEDAEIL